MGANAERLSYSAHLDGRLERLPKGSALQKKLKSTYEEFIEDEEQKCLLDQEYRELLASELLIAAMHQEPPSADFGPPAQKS